MDYNTACALLGVSPGESQENIKKAYINACKRYHPDNVHTDMYVDQYNRCQEAYEFLCNCDMSYVFNFTEKKASTNNLRNSDKPISVDAPVNNYVHKVISSKGSYAYNHNNYIKKQQAFKKKTEEKKIRDLNDIIAKSKEIQKNQTRLEHVNYKKEDDILNQIRWLRVAQIIHDTIEADKAKKDKGENL